MNIRLICAALLASISLANAWDNGGHILTMRIAFDQLSDAEKDTLLKKLRGLSVGGRDYSNPSLAATYMDGVRNATKRNNFPGMFQNWHFVRMEFTEDGGSIPSGDPDADGKADVVRGWHHWKKRFEAGETVTEKYLGETFQVGPREALAMLIHLTGDAHQPLHTTSHPQPNGRDDAGGNGVTILNMGGDSLHSFWDSAYRRTTRPGRRGRLSVSEDAGLRIPAGAGIDNDALGAVARKVIEASGLSEDELKEAAKKLKPEDWVKESHKDGFNSGYKKLGERQIGQPEVVLSDDYVKEARKVASVRIAKAGVRLGAILKELLK